MTNIAIYGFSFSSEGENLANADLEMKVNLSVSGGEQETLFSDGFESGDFTTGGWTVTPTGQVCSWRVAPISEYSPMTGSYSATSSITASYTLGDFIVWKGKDTTGFTDIQVQYAFSYSTFSCGATSTTYDNYDFYAEYSTDGGTEWTVFDSDTCGTNSIPWQTRGPFALPAAAGNNPNFQIRFRAVVSGGTACTNNRVQIDDVVITGGGIITPTFNLSVQMKTEDVDYLVYKLHNFDQNISDINDIFPDIAGTIGLNVNDDRYHSEDGSDSLITSLTANQWNNYTNSNYSIVYDNSTSADSPDSNVIALVRFNETAGMEFDSSGLWYDNIYDTEGLRIRYNTSLATTSDEINYILSFTKGDWQTIDQWMPNITRGQFPTPNFMTPPAAGVPNVAVTVNTTGFGNVLAGNSTEILVSLILNNTGSVPADIKAVFKTNVSGAVYGLMNGTSENIIPGNNFKLGPDGSETALTNTTTTTLISTLAAGANETYDAILIVPAGQAADDYDGIVELIIEASS
ncbi:MAG TPA: hypothetical protein EYP28_00680 [Methanophagales archaeon]|nr:hypothetical protein [Methanophagales archaeon]